MTSITIKEYFALAGSGFTSQDAKAIGPVLSELQKQGSVSPTDVVQAARSSNSPLNAYFEWDDAKAANNFREGQASSMLRSIRVRFVSDKREYATRAHKVEVQNADDRTPRTYATSGDDIGILAASAIRDLDAWCIKYSGQIESFGKFAEVFGAVRTQIAEFREDYEDGHISGQFRRMMTEFFAWHDTFLDHPGAARLYGEHLTYMQDAISDAKAAFVNEGRLVERHTDAA